MRSDEFKVFINEISKLLNELNKHASGESIDHLAYFEDVLEGIELEGEMDDEEIKSKFWTDFEAFVSDIPDQDPMFKKVIKNYEAPILWRFWAFIKELESEFGYSEKHVALLQGPSNPSGRHVYKDRPKPIRWKLTPVRDKGVVKFYTTSAPIAEVDAVSSVPSIKPGIRVSEASRRVLTPSRSTNEWQRGLIDNRLIQISSFLDNSQNSFANSCMIFAKTKHKSVFWDKNNLGEALDLVVDFNFLKKDHIKGANHMTDHTPGMSDLRPLSIIDGQHRIRGGMMSERGHKLDIPIILFPEMSGNQEAAKFFAEINTLSEPLGTLHEIFMRHKFKLSSHKDDRSYGKYRPKEKNYRDRANRLAYEAAASLNLHDGGENYDSGAMQNLILMLQENTKESKNYIFSADIWVKFAHKWFMPSGPYPPGRTSSEDTDPYFEEISNFFEAFRQNCNQGWEDGRDRWLTWDNLPTNNASGNKPLIQFRLPARSLLVIFPKVVSGIRKSDNNEGVISIESFRNALSVLSNIDWLDKSLGRDNYGGTGEGPWKSLCRWMVDALGRGHVEPWPREDILSESIPSVRGKGLLSEVDEGEIDLHPNDHQWPTPENPVTIVATRPINSSRMCQGRLYDKEGKIVNTRLYRGRVRQSATEEGSNDRQARFTIEHWEGIDDHSELVFETVWGNAINRSVNSTITLRK